VDFLTVVKTRIGDLQRRDAENKLPLDELKTREAWVKCVGGGLGECWRRSYCLQGSGLYDTRALSQGGPIIYQYYKKSELFDGVGLHRRPSVIRFPQHTPAARLPRLIQSLGLVGL
jgi:hypothetical protein